MQQLDRTPASGGARSQGDGREQDRSLVQPPVLSLPKGGGAIRGIDEKFTANPVTGTGSLSVPIATSPGRAGFGPQLALSYDSGAGNGPFGLGWSLSLPSITRKTDKGLPQYRDGEESDVFILSGAEDLVPVLQADGSRFEDTTTMAGYTILRYRPRIEGLFARIERWTNRHDPAESFWRSISKDNITTWYGKTRESRIADPANPAHIFQWLICESYDDKGNVISYVYMPEDSVKVNLSQVHEANRTALSRSANRYVKRIRYGNRTPYFPVLDENGPTGPLPTEWMFELVFDYGEHDPDTPTPNDSGAWPVRHDPFSSYRAGFEVRTYRLCQRVLMFHHFPDADGIGTDCLVRSTDFDYRHEQDPADPRNPIHSVLTSVTQCAYKRLPDVGYRKRTLPPVEFEYSQAHIYEDVQHLDSESLENLPQGLDNARYQWVDLDGEGVSGMLTEQATGWFYKRNLSPITVTTDAANGTVPTARLAPLEHVHVKPSLAALDSGRQQLLDLAGDGQLDLVAFDSPTPGFFERTHDENWNRFKPFESLPVLDWSDPNLKFVDLTGDGHADILITEHEAFCWYPSLAEAGFGPPETVRQALDEEHGPRLVFADRTQSIYLADCSGDGLTDLVRIRNGEVCYWPNLGYGRFGAKVTMDNAPWFDAPDLFDQRRIRLTDIDGSGVTDILYLSAAGVQIYFNQSGNSWSAARTLERFPAIDNLTAVQVLDLLGNGTACLVWSSPLPGDAPHPLRYIDLMGGQKPHLMIGSRNNLGAETRVYYAPSTKFYVQDRLDGHPWITRVPFPVHVVERIETYDHISRNRFVTRYAYHHGYFDGEEREFRGFGMVEQWDTEEFAALSASGNFPTGDNIDAASHVPPVRTKTWFHTGVFFNREHISNFFASLIDDNDPSKYYREPGAQLLPDTTLPPSLSIEEMREACRALKGSVLRQEIYALDGTTAALHPYSVSERNYTLKRLQPKRDNRHAVFFAHPCETVDYHYERNPADPRVSHAMTLTVDKFGNVQQSVAIGYGRRHDDPDPLLTDADRKKQRDMLLTYTENRYTDPVPVEESILAEDAYRTPLPCETRTYELLNVTPASAQPGVTTLFRFDEMQNRVQEAGDGSHEIAYEDIEAVAAVEDHPYRRLVEHVRTLYRPNDLGSAQDDQLALLPLGQLQSLALPGESYKLAFTPGLVTQVYGGRVTDAMLENEGRYVHSEGDANWWLPSGRVLYSENASDTAAQELAFARQHFFLPHRFRDPFGKTATVAYTNDLLLTRTIDPLGNTVLAQNDFRVLQPQLVTDPNRNRTEVVFDTLGMVAGTAVKGKDDTVGDTLNEFETDLTQAQVDDFYDVEDPHVPAPSLLKGATTRIIYDLDRFQRTRQAHPADPTQWLPVYAVTLARETHVSDPLPPQGFKIQISFSYSDGFGREIQKKIQAEPGPLVEGGPVVSPRWVGNGWSIFNNKGKPVRQYEPFFSQLPEKRHRFEFGMQVGVSPILFYDPVERIVATLHPNHTWEKVVFDSWRQKTSDVNDTVLVADPKDDPDVGDFFRRLPDSEYLPTWHALRTNPAHATEATERWPDGRRREDEVSAAAKAVAHEDTPAIIHFDSLGRPFLNIDDNGPDGQYQTRTELDIEGKPLAVIDPLGRRVMEYRVRTLQPNGSIRFTTGYDVAGNLIYQQSMDAGERRMLANVAGKSMRTWDSRGHTVRTVYDELQRPTQLFVQPESGDELLTEFTVYGEAHPDSQVNAPQALNLRGQVYRQYDGAGVITNVAFDFKGNLLESNRVLAREYLQTVDWSVLDGLTEIDAIAAAAAPLLEVEDEIFTTRTAYDTLNRPVQITTPDGSVTIPTYNEANLLEQMAVRQRGTDAVTFFVTNIDYDAKGQRERIIYATTDDQGITTEYEYERETFRLLRLHTVRASDGRALQDLHYTYDPAGNITTIRDDAQQTVFFSNTRVEPHGDYTYDALYRLLRAEGREHAAQNNIQRDAADFVPVIGIPFPNSPEALQRYVEEYTYDRVGNILSMVHQGGDVLRWKRCYQYAEDSNRLLSTSGPGELSTPRDPCGIHYASLPIFSQFYTYDAHGNMTRMPHLPLMQWDFQDQLQATSRQVRDDGGTLETTYYVYNAAGERVRKVTERQADPGQTPTRMKERIYLGSFERYREYNGDGSTVTLERETLHVMDDAKRVALVETRTQGNDGSPIQLTRYQLNNHLGSAMLEVDDTAAVISYEEYHPYGTTSYLAGRSSVEVSLKRYRYTGKERDEENSLYYHGARYYAAWLGRWNAADPAGLVDGFNLYEYGSNSPILFKDQEGSISIIFASVDPNSRFGKAIRALGVVLGLSGQHPDVPKVPVKPSPVSPVEDPDLGRSRGGSNKSKTRDKTTNDAQRGFPKPKEANPPGPKPTPPAPKSLEQQTLDWFDERDRARPNPESGGFHDTETGDSRINEEKAPQGSNKRSTPKGGKGLGEKAGKEASEGLAPKLGKLIGEKAVKFAPGVGSIVAVEQGIENLMEGNIIEGTLDLGGAIPGPIGDVIDIIGIGYSIGKLAVEESQEAPREMQRMFPDDLGEKLRKAAKPELRPEPAHEAPAEIYGPPLPEYLDIKNARIS